eukprot:gene7983-5744_t
MIIYATDDASSSDRVAIDTMPADLQAAVAFDGAVDYDVPDMWAEDDLPQHITASCGRLTVNRWE